MFWTAVLWGLGVSIGAAIGLLMFILAFWGLEWISGKAKVKAAALSCNEESMRALLARNDLTKETNEHLCNIFVALDERK